MMAEEEERDEAPPPPPPVVEETTSYPVRSALTRRRVTSSVVRSSTRPDVESGAIGGARTQTVSIVDNATGPMSALSRRKQAFMSKIQLSNISERSGRSSLRNQSERSEDVDSESESWRTKRKKKIGVTQSQWGLGDEVEEVNGSGDHRQYRLRARRKPQGTAFNRFLTKWGLQPHASDEIGANDDITNHYSNFFNLNMLVTHYLHWTFRTSFLMLFLSSAAAFFALVTMFAAIIYIAGVIHPYCIQVGNDTFRDDFGDAFALSWTTFSTVGYGAIYPQISVNHSSPCQGMNALAALCSFVGVLYAAFCGSIVYGKVARIQSQAQVIFSDPIVIRYGSGVTADDDDASTANSEATGSRRNGNAKRQKRIPCPILEFRIANRLHSAAGGEIIDANLNCVASVEARKASDHVKMQVGSADAKRKFNEYTRVMRRGFNRMTHPRESEKTREATVSDLTIRRGKEGPASEEGPAVVDEEEADLERGTASSSTTTTADDSNSEFGSLDSDLRRRLSNPESAVLDMLATPAIAEEAAEVQVIDEDPSSQLVARKIFSKLEIESGEHPFFKRVWICRHVINADSPLLTSHARRLVKRNHGFWPESLNSHVKVRNSIRFSRIMVSLAGTSNVNASSVYAQKMYDFVDVNVGYVFANALYRSPADGSLKVDLTLINDVLEQAGGGAEPFLDEEEGESLKKTPVANPQD